MSQRGGTSSKDIPIRASEVHISCGLLFDLVVLAGGPASKLAPLCSGTPKPLLPIGNRTLIYHVLRPWVDKGARTIFMCAHEYAISELSLSLEREFPAVSFKFVTVPTFQSNTTDSDSAEAVRVPTTTVDAVKAYYALKKSLRGEGAPEGLPRDAVFLSGDTILAKMDIEPFIDNFYASFASASVLLWRPAEKEKTSAAPADAKPAKGGSGQKGAAAPKVDDLKQYAWESNAFVAYEETVDLAATSSSSPSSSASTSSSSPFVSHHRMHYFQPVHEGPVSVSIGFAARRPNLRFVADVVDVHVYMLRNWVVEFIATVADTHPQVDVLPSLKLDILPLLARSQHALINKEEETFLTPFQKLKVEKLHAAFTADWALEASSTRGIGSLNAVKHNRHGHPYACTVADALRVFCTVYQEFSNYDLHPQMVRRVQSKENYLAVHHDLIRMLPGVNGVVGPCNALGLTNLETFAEEHDAALAAASATVDSRVVQSLIRTMPHSQVFITKSVIGQRVKFGKNVRINNSVVGDDVELQDDTVVTSSVLGRFVSVQSGIHLVNCFVETRTSVASNQYDKVVTAEEE